ncbi:helix-turn-helix domain-containing protein [Rugamonas sp. A1-17]|nr:helix-turn-helix domain-containing protein [Rugamonas sp. A1-17]
MITKNIDMADFLPEKDYIRVSAGESVRIVREMHELTVTQLALASGIPVATLHAIENDQLKFSGEQLAALAEALQVPPAVLMATGGTENTESAAG